MKYIGALVITYNSYPNGDPGAVRQHAMAKILEGLGYDVTIIGFGKYTGNTFCEYDGIRYTSIRSNSKKKLMRLFTRLTSERKVMRLIKNKCAIPKLILVVDVLPSLFRSIEKFALKNNCILIHDSVEWYSPEEFKNGKLDINYQLKEYTNRKAIHVPWKVISISRYLDSYFRSRGIESVRIPVIMDVHNIPFSLTKNLTKTTFVYAGGPGRKDYLKEMLEGFALLSSEQIKNAEFHVVGVDRQSLIDVCKVTTTCIKKLGSSLHIHGRVPREDALKQVKSADYSVLLRNAEMRYAKAGFPTKIVESLASGTPVICNLSSDLGLYLKDEENSLLIDGRNSEDVAKVLSRAICVTPEKKRKMCEAARKTAEEYFDYRLYDDVFKKLQENE